MEAIRVVARVTNIRDLDRFKELGREAIVISRDEPGTLQYEWYLDEEIRTCTALELYRDSDAVETHLTNVGEVLSKVLEICELKVEVFGDLDEKGVALAAQVGARPIPYFDGVRLRQG